ncbi:helix-turn-helix transcriptional regulator [Clostridium perfringens]
MRVGDEILKIRKANGMTQEKFSKLFNVTRQTVSNWENKKSYPDLETLVDISDKFDISLDVLLKGDNEIVKNYSEQIKQSKFLKNIIKFIGVTVILVLVLFITLVGVWRNAEKKELQYFQTGLQQQGFKFDKKLGYYYLEDDNIIYNIANWTELNLFDFNIDGVVDAEIDGQDISMRILSKDWIFVKLSDSETIQVDKNGNIIKGTLADKDKILYDKMKENINLMVKKGLEIYASVYKEK